MNEIHSDSDHEAIELLLPWYVNETLSDAEHERVGRHVSDCVQCQEDVAFLRSMQASVVKHSATPIVPEPSVQNFYDSISAHESRPVWLWKRPGFIVAFAAAMLLVIILGAIVAQSPPSAPTLFETATSTTTPAACR